MIQADLTPCTRLSTAHLACRDGRRLRRPNTPALKTRANKHTGKDRRMTSLEFPTRRQELHPDSPGIFAPRLLTATLLDLTLSLRSIASRLRLIPAIHNLFHMPATQPHLLSPPIAIVLPCCLPSISSRLDGLVKMVLLHPLLPTATTTPLFLNLRGLDLWRKYRILWHRSKTS